MGRNWLIKLSVCLLYSIWTSLFSVVFSQSHERLSSDEKCDNYIQINGESNVNEFNFTYNSAGRGYKKFRVRADDSGLVELSIPIKDFEASNPLMYNDFLEILKAGEHPRISIRFSMDQLGAYIYELHTSRPEVTITLAGTTRTYLVNCFVYRCSEDLYINGSKKIRLSDFNITPPEKLRGLVRVRDEIDVNFGFIITFINQKPALSSL